MADILSLLGAGAGPGGTVTLILDTFTDSNGTALHSHTPDVGGAITQIGAADFWIQSNSAAPNGNALLDVYSAGNATTTTTVSVNFGSGLTDDAGLILRFVDANDFWYVYIDSSLSTWTLKEYNSFVWTSRASAGFSVATNTAYNLKGICTGNTITGTINGGNSINYNSATDMNTGTKYGIATNQFEVGSNTVIFNAFKVTNP